MHLLDLLAVIMWVSIVLIIYTYLGYPLVLWVIALLRPKPIHRSDIIPSVSLLVTAYDEEEFISEKIRNCLALEYPQDRLQIIITSDGSDDGTNNRIAAMKLRYPRIQTNILSQRQGKMGAILATLGMATGDILVFSDATALLEPQALSAIVANFADESVGGVSGSLNLRSRSSDEGLVSGESVYWRFESLLRRLETKAGTTIVAPGSIYAVRRRLFTAPPVDTIADDLAVPLGVLAQGYRMVQEEGALATERISATLPDEFSRKVRIVAGGIQTLFRFHRLMSPRWGLVAFELISHKLLRWLVPFALIIAFVSNLALARAGATYRILAASQIFFYILATAGWAVSRLNIKRTRPVDAVWRPTGWAFHFIAINAACIVGWYRQLTGSQPATWEKTSK